MFVYPASGSCATAGGESFSQHWARAFDQPDNGSRVVRMGVGLSIQRQRYSAERVAHQLRQLLESGSYGDRARDVGLRIAAEGGVSLACDAVERVLGTSAGCG
jgi:UDP:flavonoid glycosyltransferase YjiC (YdhE family)